MSLKIATVPVTAQASSNWLIHDALNKQQPKTAEFQATETTVAQFVTHTMKMTNLLKQKRRTDNTNALRMRRYRRSHETLENRQQRLENDKQRKAKLLNPDIENNEHRQQRLLKNKQRKAKLLNPDTETGDHRQQRLENDKQRKAKLLNPDIENNEHRQQRLENDKQRKAKLLNPDTETGDHRQQRLENDKQRKAKLLNPDTETGDHRQQRLENDKQRKAKLLNPDTETGDHRQQRLENDKQRKAKRLNPAIENNEHRQQRLHKNKHRNAKLLNPAIENNEHRQQRLVKCRLLLKKRRLIESRQRLLPPTDTEKESRSKIDPIDNALPSLNSPDGQVFANQCSEGRFKSKRAKLEPIQRVQAVNAHSRNLAKDEDVQQTVSKGSNPVRKRNTKCNSLRNSAICAHNTEHTHIRRNATQPHQDQACAEHEETFQSSRRLLLQRNRYQKTRGAASLSSITSAAPLSTDVLPLRNRASRDEISNLVTATITEHVGTTTQRSRTGNMYTGGYFTSTGSPNIKASNNAASSPLWAQVTFADASGCNITTRIPETQNIVTEKCKVDRLSAFLERTRHDQQLHACASCGIRDMDDTYLFCNIAQLGKFRLSADKASEHLQRPPSLRRFYNILEYRVPNTTDICAYHLIPKLMLKNDRGQCGCYLCSECCKKLQTTGLPRFNVGNIDFGCMSELEPLTDAEELVMSKCIRYHKVYKFGVTDLLASKGHAICFEHDATIEVSKLPRTDFLNLVGVTFIGSKKLWQERTALGFPREKFLKAYPQLKVDSRKVIARLVLKQALDPNYHDIEIDNSHFTMATLDNMANMLLDNATVLDNESAARIDRVIESNVARQGPHSAMEDNIEVIFVANKVTVDISKPAEILRAVNEAINERSNLTSSQEARNPIDAAHASNLASDPVQNVNARVSSMPVNEFCENDKYFLGGFPNLFLLGQGMPNGSAGISPPCRRHMLLQYDRRFSSCASFLFVVFNQLQRHAAARSVSLRVKGCQSSVDRFEQMIRKREFNDELKAAIVDPDAMKSKSIARSIMNVCRLTGAQVPWSGLERQSALSKLLSTMNYCGPFSFFVTVSPADMDSILMLRLADLSDNGMPAFNTPLILPTLHQRHAILACNSFAAAQVYKLLIEAMFEFLFALPIENSCHSSHTVLSNRKCGVLGVPVAYGGVTEAQGRHSAHMHLLMTTDMSPIEIARVLDDETIRQQLSKRVDSVIQAWLPESYAESSKVISELQCAEETSFFRDHRHMSDLRNEAKRSESAYGSLENAAYITASCSNMHTEHKPTCQKGPVGKYRCRMAMPRSTWIYGSQFVQLQFNSDNTTCPQALTAILPRTMTHDRMSESLLIEDDRVIIFELARPINGNMTPAPVPTEQTYFTRSPICRNSSVVAFSPTLSAAFRCNTNVEFLGNLCQAKAAAYYAVKYVIKDPSELANVLSLLKGACDHVASYPSRAEDSDSSSRYCKYLIERLLNLQNGRCEWSQQLVSLALLNMPSNVFSHKFAFCFAWDAVRHVLQHVDLTNTSTPFASDQRVIESQLNIDAEVNLFPDDDDTDNTNDDENDMQTLNISTTSDGHVTTVSQVDHYRYRGECFANLSLYEYCGIVQIVLRKEEANGYNFDCGHPQHTTHCQQIRRKQCIPQLAGKPPPRHPGQQISSPNWHARATKFAQYVVALHVPWDIVTGIPTIDISFESLMEWIDAMNNDSLIEESPDSDAWHAVKLVAQARTFWIKNISHGFSVKSRILKGLSAYRAKDAYRFTRHSNLGDLSEAEASKAADYADENGGMSLSEDFMSNFELTCRAMQRSLMTSESLLITHAPLRQLEVLDVPVISSTGSENHSMTIYPCKCRRDQQTLNEIRDIVRNIKTIDIIDTSSQASSGVESGNFQTQAPGIATVSQLPDQDLNATQNLAFLKVVTWFNRVQMNSALSMTGQNAGENIPPLIFISGAAGTGKTHFVKRLCLRIGTCWIKCCAFTGNAACNLPGGNTIHSTFGIWPGSNRRSSHNAATSAMLAFGDARILIIDEISLTDAKLFGEIDTILRGWKKNSRPFGGLAVIIMGDIFQIEAIGKSLVAASIDAASVAGSLFKMFHVIQFNQQYRAEGDVAHSERLQIFRDPGKSHYPVYMSKILEHTKVLKSEDVINDPLWTSATIIVSDNQSRCLINMTQALRYAVKHKKPIISWFHDVTQATQVVFDTCAANSDTTSDLLKQEFPELMFYFVEGAPAVIKDNLSTARGITNGTTCILRSITMREDMAVEAAAEFWQRVNAAKPGEVVHLGKPPLSVNVELPAQLRTLASIPSLDTDSMVIPMTIIKSGSRFRALKLLKSRGEMTSQCGYYDHSLDLAFAITYHKAQGRTLDRVLLVFNEAGHAKMTVSSLYVGISRVRHSSHLRILSLSAKQKDMLQRLTFRTELINWWSNVLATGHLAQAHSSSS